MKTNQLMTVCFPSGELRVWHKTGMGSLTDLFNIGNKMRAMEGKSAANITLFQQSNATQEFIKVIMEEQGIQYDQVINVTGRGKSSRTEANLHLLVYAAQYLSTRFHYQVIDTFIKGKLLEWRDTSGDQFKLLNAAIDNHLPGRTNQDGDTKSNTGIYIQVAIRLKGKLLSPECAGWNAASAEELRERARIEEKLVGLLELGLVRDYDHLKEIIDKV